MFRDKVFNISFLISSAGHLFCIFAVVLVITPKGFTFNKFPQTAFLGPILEEGVFQPGYNLKPVFMLTPYKEDFTFEDRISQNYNYIYPDPLLDDSLNQIEFQEPQIQKQIPDTSLLLSDVPDVPIEESKAEGGAFADGLQIEGPLSRRHIVYSPPRPLLPEWVKDVDSGFVVELKIFISADGVVQNTDRLTTSGFAKIDSIAMEYARGLIFQPNPAAAVEEVRIKIAL